MAVACEDPKDSGRPLSHWTHREVADEAIKRQIVETISPAHIGQFLKEADLKPHRSRYWLHPPPDPQRQERTQDLCQTYETAPERDQAGEKRALLTT